MNTQDRDIIKKSERNLMIFFAISISLYVIAIALFMPDAKILWDNVTYEVSQVISQISNAKNYIN